MLFACNAKTENLKSCFLTLLHSERPKLYTILAFLIAIGLNVLRYSYCSNYFLSKKVGILYRSLHIL